LKKLLLGLIGSGIQRSLSPALQEEEARQHGLRLHYQLIDLAPSGAGNEALPGLIAAARIMRFDGLNITFPCKQAVIPLLDSLSDEARAMGAVNTVVREGDRLVGHNTDGPGWAWGFRRALPDADLSRVVLLGAGGAGAAVGFAALGLGVSELWIFDSDPSRAAALASNLATHFPGKTFQVRDLKASIGKASGVIHATPTGMAASPGMPIDASLLRKDLWLSEVVYVPLETELLKAAKRAGCRVMDGGHMNVGQAVRGFKLFSGLEADPARMEAHFRRVVSRPAAA
jgi:shikimate dehydrogenase